MRIWCKFGDSSSNPLKWSHGQVKFPKIQNNRNDLEGQGQWPALSIPAYSIQMFGANLVILGQIYEELSRGQAKINRILSQNGQNDLDGQGQ